MPYKVQFAGLVCFYRQQGVRLALLPDGRNPGAGIDPHHASIVIHQDWIEHESGWDGVQRDIGHTFPLLQPCEVSFEAADVEGNLDVADHNGKLPELQQMASNFSIDPATAQTIARVTIRQGKLSAHLIPDGAAAVSQLEVPHDGSITITVTPADGSPQRTIRARAGAEIVIANMARGVYEDGEAAGTPHYRIYEKLTMNTVSWTASPAVSQSLTEMQSNNPLFSDRGPIGLYAECSNTGCCAG